MEGTADRSVDDMALPERRLPRVAGGFAPLAVRDFADRGMAFCFRDELPAWRAESTAWSWCASAMLSAPSGGSEAPLSVAVVRTPAPRTISPERKRSARRSDGVGMVRTMSVPDRRERHRCVAGCTKILQPERTATGRQGLRAMPASGEEQHFQLGQDLQDGQDGQDC